MIIKYRIKHLGKADMSLPLFITIFSVFTLAETFIIHSFVKQKNSLYLQASLTAFLLYFVYIICDLIFGINVPKLILISVMISIFIQTFFGYYKNLFMRSKVFDRYLHAYGSFSFALFFYSLIDKLLSPVVTPKLYAAIFVFSVGITIGAIFEIIEFAFDKAKHTKMQKGLKDTDLDLIFDVIGSVAAAIISYFFIL